MREYLLAYNLGIIDPQKCSPGLQIRTNVGLCQCKRLQGPASVALNIATGFTFEFSNRFNIGAFVGVDRMFYSQSNWVYQNKGWVGFGFGYKFSGGSGEKKEEEE